MNMYAGVYCIADTEYDWPPSFVLSVLLASILAIIWIEEKVDPEMLQMWGLVRNRNLNVVCIRYRYHDIMSVVVTKTF